MTVKAPLAVALALACAFSARAQSVVTNPDWLRKPTTNEMMAVFPAAAMKQGRSGKALISCTVSTEGLLRDCKVVSESPAGAGFGAAAVVLSSSFLMKPATRDGTPIEARITIPINFTNLADPEENENGHTGSRIAGNDIAGHGGGYDTSNTVRVFPVMAWARAPTVAEVQAALDKKVGDRFADGKIVLQCKVAKKTGALGACTVMNFSPGMTDFRTVAQSLTSKFRADPQPLAEVKTEVMVNLTLSFPDMTSEPWGKRYLARTQWIRQPEFDPKEKLFPKEAAKAGLKTGSATLDCVIAAKGDLTQCTVVKESRPGVGFGDMAKRIAAGFATNPWTDDGVPAEGAHVLMPIEMVDENPAPAAKP